MLAWENFLKNQAAELGYEPVKKWLRPLTVLRYDACNLYLEAKDAFQALWFEEHIRPKTKEGLANNNGKPIKIHLSIANDMSLKKKRYKQEVITEPPPFSLTFDTLDPSFTFQNFFPCEANLLAHKLLCKVTGYDPETGKLFPGRTELASFNPIFLHGPQGSGKTHLLMATAHALRDRGLNALYVRAETFTEHVVSAIRQAEMHTFRQAYRTIDVLLIDDVDIFSNKRATQEELFHSFNVLHLAGKQIVLSSALSPAELQKIEPRLISRFEWGIVLPLKAQGETEMREILNKRADALNFKLTNKVADFLLATFTNNLKSLNRALEALILRLHLNQHKAPISVSLIKHHLNDLISEEQRLAVTPELILKEVADFFELEYDEIVGRSQQRECVLPRQIAMFLCREQLKIPYAQIGDLFFRDHSTVMSSVRLVKKKVEESKSDFTVPLFAIIKKLRP